MSYEINSQPLCNSFNSLTDSIDVAAVALADGILSASLCDTMSDPIVRQVMAADRVEPAGLRSLLREAAAGLRLRRHQHG